VRFGILTAVSLKSDRLGKLLLVLASTVILGFQSRGTHDRTLILLSHDSESRATLSYYRLDFCVIYKYSVRTQHVTHYISTTKISELIL
jgi:hypothetical protein